MHKRPPAPGERATVRTLPPARPQCHAPARHAPAPPLPPPARPRLRPAPQAAAFPDERRISVLVLEVVEVMQGLLDAITPADFEEAKHPLVVGLRDREASLATWVQRLTDLQLPHSDNQIWLTAWLAEYMQALTLDDVLGVGRRLYHPTTENLYIGIGRSTADAASAGSAPGAAAAETAGSGHRIRPHPGSRVPGLGGPGRLLRHRLPGGARGTSVQQTLDDLVSQATDAHPPGFASFRAARQRTGCTSGPGSHPSYHLQ